MSSFYIILPSNSPDFPENKINKFKVRLPKKIVFEGKTWMAGMTSCIYPNSWATIGTVDKQYIVAVLKDGRKFRFEIPRGSYLSPHQLQHGIYYGMLQNLENQLNISRKKRAAPQEPLEEEGPLEDPEEVDEEAPRFSKAEQERKAEEQRRAEQRRKEQLAADQRRLLQEEARREAEKQRQEAARIEAERKKAADLAAAEQQRKEAAQREERKKAAEQQRLLAEQQRIAQEQAKEKEGPLEEPKAVEEPKSVDENVRRAEEEAQKRAAAVAKEQARIAEEQRRDEEEQRRRQEESVREYNKWVEAEDKRQKEEENLAIYTRQQEEERARREEEELLRRTQEFNELQNAKQAAYRPSLIEPGGLAYGHFPSIKTIQGKDPHPLLRYLIEQDDYIYHKTWEKYVKQYSLAYYDFLTHVSTRIEEFQRMYDAEMYNEDYKNKTPEEKREILELAKAIQFFYYDEIGRFSIKIADEKIDHVLLSKQIGFTIGYEQGQQIKNGMTAKYAVELRGGVSHICVYINNGLIESMIMGNTFANLLQIIAVEGKHGEVIERNYSSPLFHKVIAREMDLIDIEIRTLDGREIPFDFGQIVLTIQFKKIITF